jgi:CBS domain-containing protein
MRVQDVIDTKGDGVVKVGECASFGEAVCAMRQQAVGSLVVVGSDGAFRGVLSEREVVVALARHGSRALSLRVGDVVAPDHPALEPTDSVLYAMTIMTELRVRHLPVVLGGSIVGLISIGDTVKALLPETITEKLPLWDIPHWPVPSLA